ncbi:MAG: hypothetical protein WD081_09165 [Gammaproteobacteria bacterium]
MPRLFDELQRRNVLKTLGIYVVAAWGLLQFIEIAAGIWELPVWVPQSVFVVLALGVPVAVLLSWFFNVAPESRSFTASRGLLVVWGFAAALVAFIVLPYLWPDELPNDDYRRLATLANRMSADPGALNFALYGFNAPAGSDIWTEGRHRVVAYNTLGQMPDFDGEPLTIPVAQGDLCSFRAPGCLDTVQAELDGLPSLLAANTEMLDRYRSLRASSHFSEVVRIGHDMPLPNFNQIMLAQRLVLRAAVLEFHRGNSDRAFAMLAEELAFHRRMLAAASNILTKMVALAMIAEDVSAFTELSQISATAPPAPARFSASERAVVDAYQWEAVSNLQLFTELDRATILGLSQRSPTERALFQMLPFKRTRTANTVVTAVLDVARASLLPAAEFAAAGGVSGLVAVTPFEAYINGAGAMMLRGMPNFGEYVWRIHDVDALIVLAQVARHLHAKGVGAAAIDNELLALPRELRNPYDGRPPTWSDGKLRFAVPGPEKNRWPVELVFTPRL